MIIVEHYTSEKDFKLRKFQVRNSNPIGMGNKPVGALWTSPVNSDWKWKDWCEAENYKVRQYRIEFTLYRDANIYWVDSIEECNALPWRVFDPRFDFLLTLDVEYLFNQGYDGLWLTGKGQAETRWTNPMTFYGWDCETVCLFNHHPIELVNGQPPVFSKRPIPDQIRTIA